MKLIDFFVDESSVWSEVMKNTEYVGTKVLSETDIYDSIRLTKEDAQTLARFWKEAIMVAVESLKEMLYAYSEESDGCRVYLNVANAYDTNLNASVCEALTSYFINSLTAKWLQFSNADEAQKYAGLADAMMDEVLSMLYSRMRPHRKEVEIIE